MKKNKFLIVGLLFGIIMAIFLIVQNLVLNNDVGSSQISKSIISSLIRGLVAGVFFAVILWRFSKSKFANNITLTDLRADESIVFETNANHLKGLEGVGGKLFLTSNRLVFKSHKLNIQNHLYSINVSDIQTVKRYKTAGIINNGLSIDTINTKNEKFVVDDAEEWVKKLQHV